MRSEKVVGEREFEEEKQVTSLPNALRQPADAQRTSTAVEQLTCGQKKSGKGDYICSIAKVFEANVVPSFASNFPPSHCSVVRAWPTSYGR